MVLQNVRMTELFEHGDLVKKKALILERAVNEGQFFCHSKLSELCVLDQKHFGIILNISSQ